MKKSFRTAWFSARRQHDRTYSAKKDEKARYTILVKDLIKDGRYDHIAHLVNDNSKHVVEIKLDMIGVPLPKQYVIARSLRTHSHPSVRNKIIVKDGPFITSASKVQAFIQEKTHEDI